MLLLLGFLFPQILFAQGFGGVQGVVADPSGAVVAGASVVATRTDTAHTTIVSTNKSGFFVFPKLPPADYSISVSAPGFEKYVQHGITLQANQSMTLNVELKVGSEQNTVKVVANATQVNFTNGTLSQVIGERRINELPLNGRNAAQLTTLVAGAVVGPSEGTDQGLSKTFPSVVNVSINGSRVFMTNYLLNGGNNVDEYTDANGPFPFPDALQEFSVQTSNYNAEFGENAGGVVNIVTKSGTDKFHGRLFEYIRNGIFNARDYYASDVDPLKRNQFGGTIGGPVDAPHLFKLDNTFFFFGYQKTINDTKEGGHSAYVPTDAERQGDFAAIPNPIINPATGLPFPGNQIDPNLFDPASVAFSTSLPQTSGSGKVSYTLPIYQTYDEYFGRVDHNFSQKDQIFAHFYSNHFFNRGVADKANLLTYSDGSNITYRSSLISETHVFTSHLVNNLVVNYLQEVSERGPAAGAPDVGDYGVQIYQPPQKAIELVQVKGYFKIKGHAYASFQRNSYNLSDDLHWVHGNHNFGFGFQAELSKVDINSLFEQMGHFTFNSHTTGNALADYELGILSEFIQGSGQFYNGRNKFLGFYAQDTWQATPRLSLTYGLRYEPYYPWAEIQGRTEQFNPVAYAAGQTSSVYTNAPKGLLFPGDPGVPPQGYNGNFTNFMPRLGFAYDLFGDGKTAIRGGAGIFYNTRIAAAYNASAGTVTPFSVSLTLTDPNGPFSNPYLGITNPFPFPTPVPHDVVFPSPVQVITFNADGQFKTPVVYQWNLSLEQQLTNSLVSRIAYVGSQSRHLTTLLEVNPAHYVPGQSGDGPRRYPEFSTITDSNNGANGSYNALQASLQKRFSHGFTVLANYTWSKALDDLPTNLPSLSYVLPVYTPNFRRLDIGRSDFDRRNVFSGSYVWDLPELHSGSKVLQAIVNHWQTTGIVQIQSGDPLTPVSSADRSGTALGQDRAVYNGAYPYRKGACSTSGPCKGWLNPNAFSEPDPGDFGNVRKGSFVGPGYADWDAGLFRTFPIHDRLTLQFRAEYFNVLNHANLGDPAMDVSSPGFGTITDTGSYQPRIGQMSMKILF